MINRILKIAELVEAADNSNVKLIAQCDSDSIEFKEINVYCGTNETIIVMEGEKHYDAEENN